MTIPTLSRFVRSFRSSLAALGVAWLAVLAFAQPAQAQTTLRKETQARQGQIGVKLEKTEELAVPLCPGGNVHYTLTITNVGTLPGGAEILDPIPAGTGYVVGSVGGGADYDGAQDQIVWEGLLVPGQSHSIGFSVTVDPGVPNGTTLVNQATGRVFVGETPVQTQTQVQAVVDCPAGNLDLAVKKTSSFEGPLCPGSRIRYEVTLTNTSEAEGLLAARIEDPVPANTTFAGRLTPVEGTGFTGGRVTWDGKLAPGQSQTVAFEVEVNPAVPDGTEIANAAAALLRDPTTGSPVVGNDQTEDTVDCVDDVKESQPAIDLQIWLKYAEFEDDTDHFLAWDGDMFGFAAVRLEGDPAFESTELGGVDENAPEGSVEILFPATNQPTAEDGKKIFGRSLCCTERDVELAVDFRDADPGQDKLVDNLVEIANEIGEALPDSSVSASARIAKVVGDSLKELGLEDAPPDDLGFYGEKDLKTPWVADPDRFSCPLKDAVMDGDREKLTSFEEGNESFLNRPHTIELRQGGADNGELWLEWKGYPDLDLQEDGAGCNKLRHGGGTGDGQGKIGRRVRGGTAPRAAGDPTLGLVSFSTLQASERELDLTWTLDLPAGHSLAEVLRQRGPVVLRGLLTTPRNAASAPRPGDAQAWRTEVNLSLEGGAVVAESAVYRWQDTEWVATGARAVETRVADGFVQATFDHRDVGELGTYSVAAEVLEADTPVDALPDGPSQEYLLAWKPDRMPPLVHSVKLVPREVSEGPDGELLPRGSIDKILVELSERVVVIPGDVRLEPSVDVDLSLEGRVLTVEPRELLGAGTYELVLGGGIMDLAGNRLDGNVDGTPGDPFRRSFQVPGFRFFATDRDGTEKDLFTTTEEVYASGFGFDPSARLDLYLTPAHFVSDGVALQDFTSDGVNAATTGPGGDLGPVSVGSAQQPGEYSLIADVDRDGRFRAAVDLRWRTPGIGVGVVGEAEEPGPPGPSEPPAPPAGPWLASADLPGFEAKVRITPRGGEGIAGAAEPGCIVESLCVSGALPGRPEIFVKVIGPRPNGKLWTQISRFTPSQVEVWLRQVATGTVRYYRLDSVGSASDDVSGLQDREAFTP